MATFLIADDFPLAREHMKQILSSKQAWQIHDEAIDGQDALEKAKAFCPDVAILDLSMPRMNGLEAVRQMSQTCPNTIAVMSSSYDEKILCDDLKRAGVRGFVSKASLVSELIPAVEKVLPGGTYFKAC